MSEWVPISITFLGFVFNVVTFIVIRSFGAGAAMSKFQTIQDANARETVYHSVFARKDVTQVEFKNLTDKINEVGKAQKEGFERVESRLDQLIKLESKK